MGFSPKNKRLAYILGVAFIAVMNIQWISGLLEGVADYDVIGVQVRTIIALLVLYGTWMLYKRRLG